MAKKTGFFGKVMAITLALSMVFASFVTASAINGREYVKSIPIFDTMDEALAAAQELNEELTGEGAVLLKNDGVLPLAANERVTVFSAPAPGGGNSRGFTGIRETLPGYLKDAGFRVNPIAVDEKNYDTVKASDIRMYNDVAIVILVRGGSEGSDLSVNTGELANDEEENVNGWSHKRLALNNQGEEVKHGLMLSETELAVIAKAKETCKAVVVLLNTSNAMEMYNLNEDEDINAIMFIGRTGTTGHKAVPKLLNGTLNPSGKTADIWYRDFTADPTWYNSIANAQNDAGSNSYLSDAGSASNGMHGVDYEEDIYLGYGYYESVYAEILEGRLSYVDGELTKAEPADAEAEAEAWYADNVVYPFGYGLSYTDFEIQSVKLSADTLAAEEIESGLDNPADVKTITVRVKVKNTGLEAGKKVVEIYSQAPYDPEAGVEKLAVKLVGYAKTRLLRPGQVQTLKIDINLQDMAYYSDSAEHDGVKGAYVLDAGDYILYAADSSHCYGLEDIAATLTIEGDAILGLDDFSDNLIQNLFSAENGRYYSTRQETEGSLWADIDAFSEDMVLLSRADFVGTFPKAPVVTIGGKPVSEIGEFSAEKDYAAGDVVKVTVVETGLTGGSSVSYYKFAKDHAAGAFSNDDVEAIEGLYEGGLVFGDEFLDLMAYYENYNLEEYVIDVPYFSAGSKYAEGDKVGVMNSKDIFVFNKDYEAPATLALQAYEEGAIFRSGSTIYKATKAIEVPTFEAFDNTKAYAVGAYISYNNRNYVVRTAIPEGGSVNTNSRNGNVTEFQAANLIVTEGENANVAQYDAEYLATFADKTDEENGGHYKYPDSLFTGLTGDNFADGIDIYDVTPEMIAGWSQMADADAQRAAIEAEDSDWIWFNELAGIYYNSTDVIEGGKFDGMTGEEVWVKFMNQWVWTDIQNACWQGGNNGTAVPNLGIPNGGIADSPTSFNGTYSWCCNTTIASTWNVDLGYIQGVTTASLGLLKNASNMNSAKEQWLNPAVNTHRTPFSGRNNEYYSQDGMHAGIFAAAVALGIQSTGVGCHLKHMFLNDQETNRNTKDLFAWVSEQAVRELYVKPFQMGIQEGGAEGAMSAFARLGAVPTPVNYNMCDELTRTEWGADTFFFHPDMYSPQANVAGEDLMIRTGHNHAPGGQFSAVGTSGHNAISGHWDAEIDNPLTGEKGGVVIGRDNEGTGQESYLSNNQWYIVRLRAMQMYSEYANQGHSRNGVPYELVINENGSASAVLMPGYVGNDALTAAVGENFNLSIAYDGEYEFVNYEVTNLPEGLSFDTRNSAITGKFAEAGVYTFQVKITIDKWITKTNTFKVTVE
ncbi:MAG: glycoside hydrolase family 3 C-terminal domain-containing protein [Lachnospiraceae bacterium]|nr:glycoside hydrolase family 3 C-terminal domain-containing protein [Lachnospiraceae bacterium]